MKKRVLAMILAAALACALLPGMALAAASDFNIDNGRLVAYNGIDENVVIPDGVTTIGSYALYNAAFSAKSVFIPASVTKIEGGAFLDWRGNVTVHYGGSEAQWEAIEISDYGNDVLENVICDGTAAPSDPQPEVKPEPKPEAQSVAYPSTQEVDVDGKKVEFQCYALKDEKGNDTNYIKLRDLADILNGTDAQFQVGWKSGSVTITTKTAYTKNGSEQKTPFSGQREYEKSAAKTMVDGKEVTLDSFVLQDDAGGGYTYYKLRDLGDALGVKVGWTKARGVYLETK